MRAYIKGASRAALATFRRGNDADYARADAIAAHNKAVFSGVYNGLMSGKYEYAYIRRGARTIVYTRSLRGEFVQISHFADMNGTPVAIRHDDARSVSDMARDAETGCYINIARAA